MTKRELVIQEINRLSESELDQVLAYLRTMLHHPAESALAKDWLSPEEDAAWAHL